MVRDLFVRLTDQCQSEIKDGGHIRVRRKSVTMAIRAECGAKRAGMSGMRNFRSSSERPTSAGCGTPDHLTDSQARNSAACDSYFAECGGIDRISPDDPAVSRLAIVDQPDAVRSITLLTLQNNDSGNRAAAKRPGFVNTLKRRLRVHRFVIRRLGVAMTDQERIKQQIERWGSLPNGQRESMDVMMLRALMQLSACVADQKRVIDGGQPIRPLGSYPDPLAYFVDG